MDFRGKDAFHRVPDLPHSPVGEMRDAVERVLTLSEDFYQQHANAPGLCFFGAWRLRF
jgi:hypothetical protein